MEIIMENSTQNETLAYIKAKKRVKGLKIYWAMVLGFFLVGGLLIYRDYNGNIFDLGKSYQVWMVSTWAIFLAGLGIYMYVPYFRNWEERKINQIMKKNQENGNKHR